MPDGGLLSYASVTTRLTTDVGLVISFFYLIVSLTRQANVIFK
jgi:hypothetical protein